MAKRKPRHKVSEHALLRWLERAHGIDVDGLRQQIIDEVEDAIEIDMENGYRRKLRGGMVYVLAKGGEVVTCYNRSCNKL